MCESVQAETFPQLPYISASGGRRNMALAGEGLQKPTQPKMCRTNTSSFVTTSQQPPSSQNLSFTLKAISYFHTHIQQRHGQIISSDNHLNNHKIKLVSKIHRWGRQINKQTNKQNIHIVEHYHLCTMSNQNKTKKKKINLSLDMIHSMKMQK